METPIPIADDLPEHGKRTLGAIQSAMKSEQRAPLLAVTALLDAIANHGHTVSLTDLSEMLKCDSSVITRVLGRANLLGAAPGMTPVFSLNRALHVLGLQRLRSLLVSAVLSDHAQSSNQAQCEMSVLALTTGLIAQNMADQCGGDSEQAFLCGSLRNFGEVMLATLFPAEFTEARKPGASLEATFGLGSRELTGCLLADAKLPEKLFMAITSTEAGPWEESTLVSYATGAVAFAAAMLDPNMTPEQFRAEAHAILARHVPEAVIKTPKELDGFLEKQQTAFEDFARDTGAVAVGARPVATIKLRTSDTPLPWPVSTSPAISAKAAAVVAVTVDEDRPLCPDSLHRLATNLDAQHVLLLEREGGIFTLTKGIGSWTKPLKGQSLFAPGDKNLFGLCVTLRQPMLIHNSSEANMEAHLPAWLPFGKAPESFFILPLGGQRVGQLLLVGWDFKRRIKPSVVEQVVALSKAA